MKKTKIKIAILIILTTSFALVVSSIFVESKGMRHNLEMSALLVWMLGYIFLAATEENWK